MGEARAETAIAAGAVVSLGGRVCGYRLNHPVTVSFGFEVSESPKGEWARRAQMFGRTLSHDYVLCHGGIAGKSRLEACRLSGCAC